MPDSYVLCPLTVFCRPTSDVCGDTEELVYVDPNADPIDKESTPPELDNALTIMLPLPSVPL